MPADGLTKPLNTIKFGVFIGLLGLQRLPTKPDSLPQRLLEGVLKVARGVAY